MRRKLGRVVRRIRPLLRHSPAARALRDATLRAIDRVGAPAGSRDPLMPPRHLRGVGHGDFHAVGEGMAEQIVRLGRLTREARVLDIGCGVGRIAIPLTRHLTAGSYDGFDVSAEMVAWCRQAITPRFPAFRFTRIDVANSHYNPAGDLAADVVSFPYPDDEFDFALAVSLFTHLLPSSLLNYVHEAARVLAPGGTLFATFFLLDSETAAALERGTCAIELPHRLRDQAAGVEFRAMYASSPETAIGLERQFVYEALERAGLTVSAVYPGTWAGRAGGRSYQDILVARRTGD
jgi:SAM-dependent methyltransferase